MALPRITEGVVYINNVVALCPLIHMIMTIDVHERAELAYVRINGLGAQYGTEEADR